MTSGEYLSKGFLAGGVYGMVRASSRLKAEAPGGIGSTQGVPRSLAVASLETGRWAGRFAALGGVTGLVQHASAALRGEGNQGADLDFAIGGSLACALVAPFIGSCLVPSFGVMMVMNGKEEGKDCQFTLFFSLLFSASSVGLTLLP